RLLRRQPGLPPRARCRGEGREATGVVRLLDAAAQRLGVGPELPAGWNGDGAGRRRHGQALSVRSRSPVPWPACWNVQAVVQRHLRRTRRENEPASAVGGAKCEAGGSAKAGSPVFVFTELNVGFLRFTLHESRVTEAEDNNQARCGAGDRRERGP